MSVNKYQPHIKVLPEDDANRQLANGFLLEVGRMEVDRKEVDRTRQRQMQVLPVAGGWQNVLNLFISDHVAEMEKYSTRFMILLIDFDGKEDRLNNAKVAIPNHLTDRVFILGVWSEPEALKRATLDSYETIGRNLARDCLEETDTTWEHNLLRHNGGELDRLRKHVRSILFKSS